MRKAASRLPWFLAALAWATAYPGVAGGAEILIVQCGGRGPLSTITKALKALDPRGPSTLVVSGACVENVVIQDFDQLTLRAAPGASISDTSGGAAEVIGINASQRITVQGFTIHGAVTVANASSTSFSGNRFLGPDGVVVVQSHANFSGDVFEGGPLQVVQGCPPRPTA